MSSDDRCQSCTRREMLRGALCGMVACAAGGIATKLSACATLTHTNAKVIDDRTLAIELEALRKAEGGVLAHHPRLPHPIYVHRRGDGNSAIHTAVLTECTHRGCQVEPTGTRMVCPCHGSQFELDGALLGGPADEPLLSFPVDRNGDQLLISLDTDQ